MTPGVGSWPGGLDWFAPLSPSLPLAQTVMTPSAASASCSLAVADCGSNSPPPVGP